MKPLDGSASASPTLRVIEYMAAGQAISGLENCHVPGLYSIVLKERESREKGMLRIFYAGPECRIQSLWGPGPDPDFSLLPHNHRQDITLYSLFGTAKNWVAEFDTWGLPIHEYQFGSALLNGSFSLEHTGQRTGCFCSQFISHKGVHLPADAVHTVVAQPESAWVVAEGALSDAPSLCYSRKKNLSLASDGLYMPMSRDHLSRICNQLLKRIDRAKLRRVAPAASAEQDPK
jgi:hypothetical protein